ncbi:unnamed protein product [Amoebophrya sp. A120]|nr:unnamed protein product [Amoebophrya sp. A120]|eukprot:GSA120T00022046001.1
MSYAFQGCGKGFNQPLHWDTSTVRHMYGVFQGCDDFNDPSIRSWNVSLVEHMSGMFQDAKSFNQDLGSWKLSPNLRAVSGMFWGAAAFDQNLETWGAVILANFSNLHRSRKKFEPADTTECSNTERMPRGTVVSHRMALVDGCGRGNSWPMNKDCWTRAFELPWDRVQERLEQVSRGWVRY